MPITLQKSNPNSPGQRPLMKHQEDMVSYLSERAARRKGGALFVEMRLGKTLATIRFLHSMRRRNAIGRVLVVAPLTVCRTWVKELKAEGERSVALIGGLDKSKKLEALAQRRAAWTVLNYESCAPTDVHEYFGPNDAIVLDESIVIANPRAQVSKYFMDLKKWPQWAKYVLCGNPAPESKLQYFNQMAFAQKRFLGHGGFWGFRAAMFDVSGFDWVPKVGTLAEMYREIHENAFVLRRQDAGIGPKKDYQVLYVQMTAKQKAMYRDMLLNFSLDEYDLETNFVTTQMLYLARIAGGMNPATGEWISRAKFDVVLNLLETELKGEQVVVWFRFKAELHEFLRLLSEKTNRKAVAIHGDVKMDEREQLREKFMAGEYDTVAMTISTAKRGLDFSSAATEIYYSNEYSSDARTQSEDRIVHPMKKETRLVVDVLMEDTVDEHAYELLKDKALTAKSFMSKLMMKLGLIRR